MTVMLGGMTATLSGPAPYGGGIPVHIAITAEATIASTEGGDVSWEIARFTELETALPPGLSDADRASVRGFAAVLGHHIVSHALNEATPALPLATLTPPSEVTIGGTARSTGIPAGTRLGLAAPTFTLAGDHLRAAGDLAELAP